MKFISTNDPNGPKTDLKEAIQKGLAPDGGLFMPERIPNLPTSYWTSTGENSLLDVSVPIAESFLEPDVPRSDIRKLVEEALNFPIPLVPVSDALSILELFHGPTLAFKDVGARFLARLLGYFQQGESQPVTVLVATSGDTGSAVAHGFHGVPGTKVVLLYPKGQVSEIQEKQLTALKGNIRALSIRGTFDDCQAFTKQALGDSRVRDEMKVSSANSINLGRLLPQSFYYAYGYRQLQSLEKNRTPVFIVPSGNLGNLTAGLIARKMGLPGAHFVAALNANDVFHHALERGKLEARPSVRTLSNAMDVGNPSNFARIAHLYEGSMEKIQKNLFTASFTDDETKAAMKEVVGQSGYILDPHSAVGYLGWKAYASSDKKRGTDMGLLLETAHPAKFKDTVEDALGKDIDTPGNLARMIDHKNQAAELECKYEAFREFLLDTRAS